LYLSKMLEKVLNSADAKEGINAFKNKRTPDWK
jgi:1,4-dihydroxy-2-naphthoyl-CoA synthase